MQKDAQGRKVHSDTPNELLCQKPGVDKAALTRGSIVPMGSVKKITMGGGKMWGDGNKNQERA